MGEGDGWAAGTLGLWGVGVWGALRAVPVEKAKSGG